jgi:hypothetical protein
MTHKTAFVVKPYTTRYGGYEITVPIGSVVSNKTACGYDDTYRFWQNFHTVAKQLTGFERSILAHDLTHYGLNVPAEFCEPYKA